MLITARPWFCRAVRQKQCLQYDCFVVALIFCCIEQRHGSRGCLFFQNNQLIGLRFQLVTIPGLKLGPLRWIMAEPFAEFRAGRNLLEPDIDACPCLCKAPRPKPVHKDARSVRAAGFFIDALDFNSQDKSPFASIRAVTG
jgi:hypothetical protein